MSEPLLTTKITIPPASTRRMRRARLVELFAWGLSPACRLMLVCAPAGYGKTTLVTDWIYTAAPGVHFAWLALDEADNALTRFYTYLLASLQKAHPVSGAELGAGAAQLVHALPTPPPETILASLINDLAALETPLCLVLDDYQVIHTPAVHAAVTYLIKHAPAGFHLVMTSRSDPPFPLHRYRARGQMVEIRLEDLRFRPAEVTGFLETMFGLQLLEDEIEILEQRTEGWAAGLQMAALSMRGRADISGFVRSLSGAHRFILDYLAQEALVNQPAIVQQFLLLTSIMERFNAELCEAVLGGDFFARENQAQRRSETSAEYVDNPGFSSSVSILEYLEQANLFLIPLDDERRWYRYHALFADLLRVRLKQAPPAISGGIAGLHRRAAAWYAGQSEPRAAIEHLIQAQAFDEAAALVEHSTMQLFAQGELQALVDWVRLLPAELAARRPWLSIYQAWALAFAGKLGEVEPLLAQARQAIQQGACTPAEQRDLQAEMLAIQAVTAVQAGDIPAVLALVDTPEDLFFPDGRPDHRFAFSVLRWSQGFVWRIQGRLPQAIAAFEAVLEIGRQIDNPWTILSGTVDLGIALRLSGRLNEAEQVYRAGLARLRQANAVELGFVGRLESFLAAVLYEKNALEEAAQLAQSSLAHGRLWGNPSHTTHACTVLARIHITQGALAAAEQALQEAQDVIARGGVVPSLVAGLEALRLRLWLAQGRLVEATQWEQAHPLPPLNARPVDEIVATSLLTAARSRLAGADTAGARQLLAHVEADARAGGKGNSLIEVLALQALAAPTRSDAFRPLSEALALGLPAGYRRVFLDEGEPMRVLLAAYRAELQRPTPHTPALPAVLVPLLNELLPAEAPAPPPSPAGPSAEIDFYGLSGREVEVLRLMAEGLSNEAIGQRLYISTGTVKAHSASIYRKLEAANRTQATARAKDLGLL